MYLGSMAADLDSRGLRTEWKVGYDEPGRAVADAVRFNSGASPGRVERC